MYLSCMLNKVHSGAHQSSIMNFNVSTFNVRSHVQSSSKDLVLLVYGRADGHKLKLTLRFHVDIYFKYYEPGEKCKKRPETTVSAKV